MPNKKQEEQATDDALLDMLLTLVEEDGVEINVTLTINGAVVTGDLIGASSYYDGITESAKDLEDSTLSKIIAKKFSDMKEAYLQQKQEDSNNEEESPTFVHLKNANYLGTDGTNSSTRNMYWWRGRISSIDAIALDHFD